MNKGEVDLLHSSIRKNMLKFATPLFLGQLFQQLYNMVDALVVGKFVGVEALAAVTSTGSLTFLLVGFFGGVFTGVGVVIARCFGAGDDRKVSRSVGTAVSFALISGAAMTLIGTVFSPLILRLMDTPPEVFGDAVDYIRTYFFGIIFVILYNAANGIFQAIGDSRRPLYYLIISSLTNVVLDLVFVKNLGWGVRGAAVATVISQGLSVVLAFIRLARVDTAYRVTPKVLCIDRDLLKQMIRIGLPSGVQNSVIAFANVIVQSSVNSFGASAVAGNGAYIKIEGFAFIPINAFTSAVTTFVSQNIGAGQFDRVKKGARFGVLFACACAAVIGIVFYILAPQIVGFFVKADETAPADTGTEIVEVVEEDPISSEEAIASGVARGRVCSLFYFLLALSHGIAAVCRGAGFSKVPMYTMLGSWCVFRVSYIEAVNHLFHNITYIYMAYPITWAISSVIFVIYYYKSHWLEKVQKQKI